MITLAPLPWPEGHTVAHLAPFPDQIKFAGTVEDILREPPARFDLHQILDNNIPVGVFKIDRAYSQSFPFAATTDIGLRALILDARAQGKGVAKAAMSQLAAHLSPLYQHAPHVYLTVNFENHAAFAVYKSAGFETTGEIWPHGISPQHVMRLPL